jgi:ribose-phosphate pyrophosphokinase
MKRESATVYGFPESIDAAGSLADALQWPLSGVSLNRFPDGESLVRLDAQSDIAVVYRSLNRPNEKLVELMLAASALREAGARLLVLVAPYLCYMRQDIAFHPGEAVSQKVVGQFLDGIFDAIVTVDPHLHRTERLSEVFPSSDAVSLSASSLFAAQLRADGVGKDTILVGPDSESRQWVEAVAQPLGLEVLIGEKTRQGDRSVDIEIPGLKRVSGRPVVIIDDVVSTGGTLTQCAKILANSDAATIEVLTVHALWREEDEARLRAAGITRLRSTDSIPHASNAMYLAPLIAEAFQAGPLHKVFT